MLVLMGRQPTIERTDIVALAFRLAATVRREFATRMVSEQWARDANLRRGCFGVLRALERADGPTSQREVAERTGVDASDVVDLVDRLEQAGYVRRQRDERDRRRYALELTPAGQDAIERFAHIAREVDEAVLAVLEPEERDTVRDLIARIVR
jgi:MarR family transcriptional regulator, lower aerobic nicotinate degradation pathway regulator